MYSDIQHWLALLHVPGIGPRSYRALLQRFTTAEAILGASERDLAAAGVGKESREYLRTAHPNAMAADIAWLDDERNHIITWSDAGYPALLREIADPPLLLFVHGDLSALSEPQLAMVGSRNPTPSGAETAYQFAEHLSRCGLYIISGLALGIDAASHKGALAAGAKTIAVTATGLDRVYPASHRELAHAIAVQGALVSEFPIGSAARAGNFPRRNRIISGLSLGTLVVEAALRSGSLITARHALEQGREVFAIPGSIHNPQTRGCHALIRQGAKLVETAQDVLEELTAYQGPTAVESIVNPAPKRSPVDMGEEYRHILTCLDYAPVSVDILVQRSGLTAEVVSSMLLLMELQGDVASAPGGLFTRVLTRN